MNDNCLISDNPHEGFMRAALAEARAGALLGEVPVGAVAVLNGEIIARAHNEKEAQGCATRHAELIALERASAALQNWYLENVALYVTLEPCAMCAGAAINCRIGSIIYGTGDPKAGFCGSLYDLTADTRLNHRIPVVGGVLAAECAALLSDFFKRLRSSR